MLSLGRGLSSTAFCEDAVARDEGIAGRDEEDELVLSAVSFKEISSKSSK